MAFPFTAIAVAAQLVVAAADGVPNINYESGCRAAAAASASLGITVDNQSVAACMAEEKDAHDKLVQQWTQFPPNDRVHCAQEAALGQMPSYVELQTCLQIARETRTLPKLESFVKKSPSTRGR
ncbi:MAG: hypothetical protein K2Z80_26940 [Xanthobacteraceae bacterium]|nr:hypothetical protein [Xanthobacteraceae bacterium]